MHDYNPSEFLFPMSTLTKRSMEEVAIVLKRLQGICQGPSYLAATQEIDQAEQAVQLVRKVSSIPAKCMTRGLEEELVADSGYASAEEDGDEDEDPHICAAKGEELRDTFDMIRNDPFERGFAVRWLTSFIARSSSWAYSYSDGLTDEESEKRELLVEMAASLLSCYTGSDEGEDLTRQFDFTLGEEDSFNCSSIKVELNDALLSSTDHNSVGLQSWASSIIFAKLLCGSPQTFGLRINSSQKIRILELGAGTGLLSIVSAKILASYRNSHAFASEIVATDYHPDVLANLRRNVETNFPLEDGKTAINVLEFDWECPSTEAPFDEEFDIILAADVIYNPCHASWIRNCVSRLLKKPSNSSSGGCFWMAIPIRTIGRHEGLDSTVIDVFPTVSEDCGLVSGEREIKTTMIQELSRCEGVGRADETGYRLFKICWV